MAKTKDNNKLKVILLYLSFTKPCQAATEHWQVQKEVQIRKILKYLYEKRHGVESYRLSKNGVAFLQLSLGI